MRTINHLSLILFGALLLLTAACSTKTETKTFTMDSAEFVFEPPLFPGPNTAQISYNFDLSDATGMQGVTAEDLVSVKLQSASIAQSDSSNLSDISSLVVQFASDNTSMIQAAVKNPVEDSTGVSLNVSSEADLAEAFRDGQIYILLDATLETESWEAITLLGNFEFSLDVKSQN